MKKLIVLLLAFVLLCVGLCGCATNVTLTTGNGNGAGNSADKNDSSADFKPNPDYDGLIAVIDIKDYGKIAIELDHKNAPITVENFVDLSRDGFYDGLTFHRIMEGFMMQGGDPQGNGYGGSDKTIKGEFKNNGVNNPLSHTRGAISMARNGVDMNSASSQFFIVHEDSLFLDGDYACFGYVIEGMDVVDAVCKDSMPIDNNGTIPPTAQPVIKSISINKSK